MQGLFDNVCFPADKVDDQNGMDHHHDPPASGGSKWSVWLVDPVKGPPEDDQYQLDCVNSSQEEEEAFVDCYQAIQNAPPEEVEDDQPLQVNGKIQNNDGSVSIPHKQPRWLPKHYPWRWANVIAIWIFAFLLHFHTMWGTFVWDDRAAVINNKDVNGQSPHWTSIFTNDFWGAPLTLHQSHKSYRPLTTLTYRLNFMVHDFHPKGYHIVNILLHATVCALVLLTARSMLGREIPSIWAALLFLAHPIHVESICPIVGRADCLCGVFYLSALLVYRQAVPKGTESGSLIKSALGVILASLLGLGAFLSKEVGLTVFGLFVVHDLYPEEDEEKGKGRVEGTMLGFTFASLGRLRRPAALLRLGLCFACLGGLLYLRLLLHGERTIMHWSILENEIAHMDTRAERGFAVAHVHFIYLWKLLFPFRQSYDYGYACINHVTSLFDIRNVLVLSTYLFLGWVIITGLQRRLSSMIWPMALLLVSFSPAAHIFFFVGAVVAERLLYLPSAGFCMLVAALLDLWVRGELSANKDQKHQAVTQKEGGEARVTAASITIVAAATAAIANDAQRDAATAAAAAAATTTPAAAVSRTAATASITTVEAAAASSTAAAAAITSDTQHAAAATATTTPATEGENIQHDDAAAVADLIDEKNKRLKRCMFGLSLWIILLASRSAHHAWIWRSEEPVFENAIRTCPRSAKVLNNHALGMLNATHAREAQRELAVAIEVFPEYANAHYNKALSHFLLGEHQLAVKHFGISLRSDTCNLMAYSYLGQSELMLFEKARTMPVDGVSDEGRNITSVTTTATTNFQLSKDSLANRAAAHLDHAIAHGLESPSTFHYRGSLALALNKPQLAAYYLEKALGAHGKAVEEKQLIRSKIVRQYSDDLNVAFTRNQLGLAYKAMDMPHEAEQEFLRGLQHEPNSYELLANLGTIFLENNELDLALVWLQKALELNPNSRDLLNNMGVVEEKRGAYHRARKYFLRALEQSPHHQNPTVVNNIKRVEQALQGMY